MSLTNTTIGDSTPQDNAEMSEQGHGEEEFLESVWEEDDDDSAQMSGSNSRSLPPAPT